MVAGQGTSRPCGRGEDGGRALATAATHPKGGLGQSPAPLYAFAEGRGQSRPGQGRAEPTCRVEGLRRRLWPGLPPPQPSVILI